MIECTTQSVRMQEQIELKRLRIMELEEECITLRRLLVEAVDQLQIHDEESWYITPQELKDRIKKAVEGKKL